MLYAFSREKRRSKIFLPLTSTSSIMYDELQSNYLRCQHENCKSSQIGNKNMLPLPWPFNRKIWISCSNRMVTWYDDDVLLLFYTHRCHFNTIPKCQRPFSVIKASDVVVEFFIPILFQKMKRCLSFEHVYTNNWLG